MSKDKETKIAECNQNLDRVNRRIFINNWNLSAFSIAQQMKNDRIANPEVPKEAAGPACQ